MVVLDAGADVNFRTLRSQAIRSPSMPGNRRGSGAPRHATLKSAGRGPTRATAGPDRRASSGSPATAATGIVAFMRISVSEGLRSLSRAKLRSALALTGIVIGVGSVITMISIGEIARETSRASSRRWEPTLSPSAMSDGASVAPGRSIVLADALLLADSVPSILEAAPRIELRDKFHYAGKELGSGRRSRRDKVLCAPQQAGTGARTVHLPSRSPQALLRGGRGRSRRPCAAPARLASSARPSP